MPVVVLVVVVAAFAAFGVAGAALYRARVLRRALRAERAARRLTAGMRCRDVDALHRRIEELIQDRRVLDEAESVLDTALAVHRTEGGSL